MAAKRSAGISSIATATASSRCSSRTRAGPFWAKKDLGAWTIPEGRDREGEDPLAAARREVHRGNGIPVEGEFTALQPIKQKSGKLVLAWAVEGDCEPAALRSNLFTMEYPPKSGRQAQFPEIDRAAWFTIEEARTKLLAAQLPLLDELVRKV
jgi:predicted NUDIX family NTP pyrophosphohydrolase